MCFSHWSMSGGVWLGAHKMCAPEAPRFDAFWRGLEACFGLKPILIKKLFSWDSDGLQSIPPRRKRVNPAGPAFFATKMEKSRVHTHFLISFERDIFGTEQCLHGFKKPMLWISDFWHESIITLLKTYEPTKRALIQTRRGETDYGEHDRHGFVKSMFWKMTLTRIRHNHIKKHMNRPNGL